MDLAKKKVDCLILTRIRGGTDGRVYLREDDRMPLRVDPLKLTAMPETR